MACFTRSVVWRFWTAVLLLSDMLLHLVHAVKLEENSSYLACLANPAGCVSLSLYDLGLSGSLPTELGLLTAMTHFILYRNNLIGTLPTELGLMTAVTEFDVQQNNLDSSLPTELGMMTAMTKLDVAGNNLDSSLPTELGMMTAMEYFYVYGNAGLCGPLVDVGNVGYTYGLLSNGHGTTGTNLENECPTIAPTSSPTNPPTATPTSSPTNPATATPTLPETRPCCEELRQNPVFCCIEAKKPALAQSVCRECGTGK